MSWLSRLHETYESALNLGLSGENRLMPISHTIQNAHVKITVDGKGNFLRAEVLEKQQIVLPATEKSAGRGSGEAPHPLSDKIQYVAKDYPDYGGGKKAYFDGYLKQLSDWVASEFSNKKIEAIKVYVEKGCVVGDLVKAGVLFVDNQNKLIDSWSKGDGDAPAIVKTLPKEGGKLDQGNAMVCWNVEIPGESCSETWKDLQLQERWIQYADSLGDEVGFCSVTGKVVTLATNHPNKLRYSGDKAKLVSSNDSSGFTYRGRFAAPIQALGISYDVTQKAHNALRWLIGRQGFRNGDQAIVAWAVSGKAIPSPMVDSWELLGVESIASEVCGDSIDHARDVGQSYAEKLKKYILGYNTKLQESDQIIIMGLDSATPGRMSVTYYQEYSPEKYLSKIESWHHDFAWFQRHKDEKNTIYPISSPSIRAIVEAAYGEWKNISDSLKKNCIERVLPCILEGRSIPSDLVNMTIRSAVKRESYSKDNYWQWERNLGIACSLYRGFCFRNSNIKKEYQMGLETENTSRDYLFGRLLAIAERIEDVALYTAGEGRTTNATRMMQRFADRPATTWKNLELSLNPYMQRLRNNRAEFLHNSQVLLDEIISKFEREDFTSDKALTGEFLLAYHCQRMEFGKQKEE